LFPTKSYTAMENGPVSPQQSYSVSTKTTDKVRYIIPKFLT
jgi:hypothetical protein